MMLTIRLMLASLALALAGQAQDSTPVTPKQATPQQTAPETAAKPTWPELAERDLARASLMIRRLESDEEDVALEAESTLATFGPAIAPTLLRRFADRDRAIHAQLGRVLDRVLTVEHAPLLAPLLERKQVALRRYVALRLARFLSPALQPTFEQALDDKDEETVFHAALGLCGLGKFEHLEPVFARCKENWRDVSEIVGEVLAPARSPAAAQALRPKLQDPDEGNQITGLRLMRSLCPRELAGLVAMKLEAQQHAIKKAAINALRVIVDGEAPLENLSVFQAIEHAKQWKARL